MPRAVACRLFQTARSRSRARRPRSSRVDTRDGASRGVRPFTTTDAPSAAAIASPIPAMEPILTAVLAWTPKIHLPACLPRPFAGATPRSLARVELPGFLCSPPQGPYARRGWQSPMTVLCRHRASSSRPPSPLRGRPDGERCGPAPGSSRSGRRRPSRRPQTKENIHDAGLLSSLRYDYGALEPHSSAEHLPKGLEALRAA